MKSPFKSIALSPGELGGGLVGGAWGEGVSRDSEGKSVSGIPNAGNREI